MAAHAALTVVSGNVYDVGKYSFVQGATGATDGAMCWAAAAANVIQHWQDTYITLADNKDSVPNGTTNTTATYPRGSGELDVYNAILDGWYSGSGVPFNAISWWMQGPTRTSGAMNGRYEGVGAGLKNEFTGAGYYKKLFGNVSSSQLPVYPDLTNAPFYSLHIDKFGNDELSNPPLADVCTTLKEAFKVQGQAVSLLVQPNAGGSGHAITCWGYEEDANGNITSLILTDSDDRKFGAFMVNVAEGSGKSAIIQTDRYNSWYHGDYTIKDVVYITTPTEKAVTKEEQAPINNLESDVLHSGQLTKAVDTSRHVTIGGGTYESGADEAVVFTTKKGASISIHDTTFDSDGSLLTIEDGGMALISEGLALQGGAANSVQGVEVLGHLYVHGGTLSAKDFNTTTAGAAIHGGVLDDTFGFFTTDGLYATSYIEVKNTTSAKIENNHADVTVDEPERHFGGGAVSAEDSFSFRDNAEVAFDNNSMTGNFVYGGAAYAAMEATLSDNGSVAFTNNSVDSINCLAEGGALAAMFTNVCGNGSVTFSGNNANNDNNGKYSGYPDPVTGVYLTGANAYGGAVGVAFPSAIMKTDFIPAEFHMDGNGAILFKDNTVSASLENSWSLDANACGGALYVGNLLQNGKAPLGAQATISNNTGEIIFSGNKAVANSYREAQYGGEANGYARGGAIAVAQNASLTIDGNKSGVSFSNNSAKGSLSSQGGAVHNEGNLQITNNGAVEFSDNTAAEGSHLYNAMGATAEIAWNESVRFSAENAQNSTVVNKGTMYLAAEEGQSITFHNTTLDTLDGTLYLGKDVAGKTHATTLSFTGDASAPAAAPRTDVSSLSGLPTELSGLSLSLNSISSKQGGDKVSVDDLNVSTDTDLVVNGLVLGSNVQLAETDKEHALTLSNVVVDLGNTKYTVQQNDRGGKNYIFDLQSMLSGNITLSGITFDASDLSDTLDFVNDDRVCMMFGDVNFTLTSGKAIELSYVGWGGAAVEPYYIVDGSNVYFGEYFEVPEPATGTLSLLALTLLAARRRRK